MSVHIQKAAQGRIAQTITARTHSLLADEPLNIGDDLGMTPHELLDAALGACTALTLRLYAKHKGWDLQEVSVTLQHASSAKGHTMTRQIVLVGELDATQRARLLDVAHKCPVHKALSNPITIDTHLIAPP